MPIVALILATDSGERMKTDLPPALHPVLGDPALLWVLRALPPSVAGVVVAGPRDARQMADALASWQAQGLLPCPASGVASAPGSEVQAAAEELDRLGASQVLVVSGAAPLLRSSLLERLAASEGMRTADEQAAHAPCPCLVPWKALKQALAEGKRSWMQAVESLVPATGGPCAPEERMELVSRTILAALQAEARDRVNAAWLEAGVTFMDPATTWVGPRVSLGEDVVLEPGVRLEGDTRVAAGVRIGQGSIVRDSHVGPGVDIRPYCVIQSSEIGAGARIGPFAHLREGSRLEDEVHVGNFVETKKTILHMGAKANHLSYLGDAEVGERTNLGAGFISCNYDGFQKHRTVIGKDAFVGSDCQLVAPVTVGDGAILGAGSTITEDVPAGALALTRAPLVVKEDAARRLREKLRAKRGWS